MIHRLVLLLWATELIVFPALAVADLGFSQNLLSNYFLRFSYIALLLIAVAFHVIHRRLPVVRGLSIAMGLALAVGVTKGLIEGQFGRAFFSHVFYVTMPIVMLSYGYFFFQAYQQDEKLRWLFRWVMIVSLAAGLIAVAVFVYAYQAGLANYNAVGLWNFVLSGPYLLNQGFGGYALVLSTVGVVFAAKRGIIAIFGIYLLVAFFLKNRRLLWIATLPAVILLAEYDNVAAIADRAIERVWSHQEVQRTDKKLPSVPNRLTSTLNEALAGNLDVATGGRWSEIETAFGVIISRIDHVLLGVGFGATYRPWPDRPGYDDYYVHYVHFTPLSYTWIGGVVFAAFVYGYFLLLGTRLILKAWRGGVKPQDYFLIYWFWGVIAVSILGAALMNNSWLWLIIGGCIAYVERDRLEQAQE